MLLQVQSLHFKLPYLDRLFPPIQCQKGIPEAHAHHWWWLRLSVVSDSCNPMDCSLPGISGHEISQARILESSQPRSWTHILSLALAGGFFTAEPLGIPMSIIRILFQFVNYIFVYVLWSQYEENGLQGEKYWLRPWTVKLEILGLRYFPTVGRFWKFLVLPKPIGFLPHHLHPTDSRWEQRQVDSVGPSPLGTRRGQLVSPTPFSPAPAPSWFQFYSFLFFLSLCWTFVYYGRALVFRNYDRFAFTHKPSSQLGKMKNKNIQHFILPLVKWGESITSTLVGDSWCLFQGSEPGSWGSSNWGRWAHILGFAFPI